MNVSIIIPAYNAVLTIRQTLDSLLAQTFTGWEAVVVDDGSTDETAVIVAEYARHDNRFFLFQQFNQGGSAARNSGLVYAHFDWVLFLDADDWLLPQHLEKLTAVLQNDNTLDGVHCGWTRIFPSGEIGHDSFAPSQNDLFEQFAQTCIFQPHTCLVRRSLVEAVGGWDAAYRSCQDWDLWQRITRKGAKFAAVREVLARYRTRPGSVSLHPEQLLLDGLRVITQGHAPDPRVSPAKHENGRSASLLADTRLRFVCWPAGLLLGEGKDPNLVMPFVSPDHNPNLEATPVAELLFEAALLPNGLSPDAWVVLWPQRYDKLVAFLQALETQAQAVGLAARVLRHLEFLILQAAPPGLQMSIGTTQAVVVEVTQPIPDFVFSPAMTQLVCRVLLEGERLGLFSIVLQNGQVDKETVAAAIAQQFAWPIIGRFFAHTLQPHLHLQQEADGISVWRNGLLLARGVTDTTWAVLHDQIGWQLFLQEMWQRPTWPAEHFYDQTLDEETCLWETAESHFIAEMTQPLPDVLAPAGEFTLTLTVADTPVCQTTLPISVLPLKAQTIRAVLTQTAGFALCQVVVREALLGQPLQTSDTLLDRLKEKAVTRAPFFSIIVPTYGRSEALVRCVHAIMHQTYPHTRFELWLVNDGGPPLPDVTTFQTSFPINVLHQPHAGPAAARNLAARQARGNYLVFTDDDCCPPPNWLAQLALQLRQTPHQAIGGPVVNGLPENVYAVATQAMVDYLYEQQNTADTQFLASSNLVVPAQLFHVIGGFDPVFTQAAAEDRAFCLRWRAAGHQLRFVSQAAVYHAHSLTFSAFWQQHVTYGQGAATLRQLHYQQTGKKMPFEAVSFYLNLMLSPLKKGGVNGRSLKIFLLLLLAQVATAWGFWSKGSYPL